MRKVANRETDKKQRRKHNLLGGGNKSEMLEQLECHKQIQQRGRYVSCQPKSWVKYLTSDFLYKIIANCTSNFIILVSFLILILF